ncbi:DNRLRE domain-containing protein [Clostridium oryzae]|uniref:Uncharacterized protein n=1 Tax=Clostridium oryzae TaxID=1450648 RepID=A0A1V4IET3_9CLOT|nr:DNRLRE domain-containing protein [Clostridium oryzae]OPJ58360.1 hypothetical protein CLORY_36540 [Clostridium oryzae]
MKSIIIPASKSVTISDKFPNKSLNDETIIVGYDGQYTYSSFLFFDFSLIPNNIMLISSELVLFKCDNFFNDTSVFFDIYPLYDYFSSYSTYNNPPSIKHFIRKSLYPFTSKVAITSNITDITALWNKSIIENRGLAICGKKCKSIATFGSSKAKDKYLNPFIKINFDKKIEENNPKIVECPEKCCHCHSNKVDFVLKICNINTGQSDTGTIIDVQVEGTVQPFSVFVAIIEVVVTRASGKIDKYYQTDEYDNSLSDSPLLINKTYSIAIVPKLGTGDTTDMNFYGSYKA